MESFVLADKVAVIAGGQTLAQACDELAKEQLQA
jgi:hypothetical protein